MRKILLLPTIFLTLGPVVWQMPRQSSAQQAAQEPAAAEKTDETNAPDYSDQLPRIAPVAAERAEATFEVKPPLHIELVAAEPLVHDPVAMAFDADARLYVVEMRGYSEQRDERRGAVRRLTDDDGDGRFDTGTVFADKLLWPVAVACWQGGVFVGDPPDIWYMKDTNGDGVADVRRRVLTGFSHRNVQAMMNSLQWGLDNRLHGATSRSGGEVRRADDENAAPLVLRGRDFAFDPRTLRIEPTSGGGQHGMTFDDWGRKFVCDNSHHIQQVMYEDRYVARNPHVAAPAPRIDIAADGPQADVYRISPLEPWRVLRTRLRLEGTLMQFRLEGGGRPAGYFTSASGLTIYRGDNWPLRQRGLAIVADVGSNIIHRKRLEPHGLEFVARRIDEQSELVASRDVWFRPVQFANGPDGCLYAADMYREIIEHPDSFGDVIKKYLELTSGRERGRIYRLRTGRPQPPPRLAHADTERLVALLAHRNAWHRETAARLLYERQDRAAIGPLRTLAVKSDAALARMHAMYALAGLDALRPADVLRGLDDKHPRVRQHAVRLAERLVEDDAIVRQLLSMTADDDLGVRYQLAFTLGELTTAKRLPAVARIAARDATDRWVRLAVLSSLCEGADRVFLQLATDADFRRSPGAREMLAGLATLVARQNADDAVAAVVDSLERFGVDDQPLAAAVVRGLSQGMSRQSRTFQAIMTGSRPTAGAQRFRQIVRDAARTAADSSAPVPQRVDAVKLAGLSPLGEIRETLADLLDGRHPPQVGEAALEVLGRYREPEVAELIIAAWPTLGPQLRSTAVELLALRAERVPALLDAIEQGRLNAGDLSAPQIQRLCRNEDDALRERAIRLLSPSRPGKRSDVVAAYLSTLEQPGDAQRGRELFRKHCTACHKAEGVGHELGPNLATFKHRGPEAILVSVLDPNREVNPQYATYSAVTTDGRVLSGMLTAETATSVSLTREEGKSETLLRSEIEELRGNNVSLMPEGLEKNVAPAAMADLIAYLLRLE